MHYDYVGSDGVDVRSLSVLGKCYFGPSDLLLQHSRSSGTKITRPVLLEKTEPTVLRRRELYLDLQLMAGNKLVTTVA
jgi:hypothetical protein